MSATRKTSAISQFSKLIESSSAGACSDRTFIPSEKLGSDDNGNFARSLPIQGSQRTSSNFNSITRNNRFEPACALDMTNLPHTWYDVDNKKDVNAGRFEYYGSKDLDLGVLDVLKHRRLMLPSERFAEAQYLKKGLADYKAHKELNAKQAKQVRVTTHGHWKGLIGVDGPMYPDTDTYPFVEDRQRLLTQQAYKKNHADKRREYLAARWQQDPVFLNDAVENNSWQPPTRSSAIPLQRKCVDPVEHPYRWHDTHARLHPKHTPQFDPLRAKIQMSHQHRERKYNIISNVDNHIEGIRARTSIHPDTEAAAKAVMAARQEAERKAAEEALKTPLKKGGIRGLATCGPNIMR